MSIRRLATGLVAVPALLLAGLAVPSLAASASPAAATTAQDTAAATLGVAGTLSRGGPGEQWGTIDGRGDLTVLGTDTSWYQIAATATAESLKQVNPRLIQANSAANVTFYHVKLVDAAKQHLFTRTLP